MSIVFKIIKRIILALISLVIAGVIALLLWRVISAENPKELETLTPNERVAAAYSEKGEDLYMFRQKQRSITSGEKNYGYFSITDYVIIPDANQIQTLVRYNTSTLEHTAEDFGLDAVPSREEDVYDVTIVVAIDLTPENTDDNLGNKEGSVKFVRCAGKLVLSEAENIYNYRRMVFQLDDADIDIKSLMESKLLLAVYADFCYVGAIDYSTPYGTLCLYDYLSENVRVELEKNDIAALDAFVAKAD